MRSALELMPPHCELAVSELLYGIERNESIIIGNVVQSEFLVTTHDAPNSHGHRMNVVAIKIEPRSIGT